MVKCEIDRRWIKNLIGQDRSQEIESIADHSWSVAMLAISIIEKYKLNYDIAKCMKLSIIHELGEIYAGDFTPSDNITLPYLKEILDELINLTKDNDMPLNIKNKINVDLIKYIENEIFPLYERNEEGHGINHIKTVIQRSLKLAKDYDVDYSMVYTIASYHDLGHYIDRI